MTTVWKNPSRKEMLNHLFQLETQQGIKVFLTPDGIAWITGTFHTDKKRKNVSATAEGGKKIKFVAS